MRRIGLVALCAAAVAASCGGSKSAIHCAVAGEWPHTADAAWVAKVIAAAGYERTDCTGSAFVIGTGGTARTGHDLYVWANRTSATLRYSSLRARVARTTVQYDRIRAVWRARGRNMWIEAGPTTPRLLPVRRLEKLVQASIETR